MNVTPAQGVDFLMTITARLGRLWMWSLIWLIHLSVLLILCIAVWWFQITPADIADALQRLQASKPALFFVAVGGSVAGLGSFYWKLLRWVHDAVGKEWLSYYVTQEPSKK